MMLKPAPYALSVEKALFYGGWLFTLLVLLFLIAPILAIVPLSFNAEPYFSYPMPGLSLQWYRDFFGNDRWTGALFLSIKLAITVNRLPRLVACRQCREADAAGSGVVERPCSLLALLLLGVFRSCGSGASASLGSASRGTVSVGSVSVGSVSVGSVSVGSGPAAVADALVLDRSVTQ